MRRFLTPRPVLLSVLIILGLAIQSKQAEANGTRDVILAGGCFWCVEADFEKVRGVTSVVSGYTGGKIANPTYKQVSRGNSGHYEAVRITYNPSQVSLERLLTLFFRSVDPTDAGGQFCDRGNSYRTAIFVENDRERAIAQAVKATAQRDLGRRIVTPILAETPFYQAEPVHQNYYKGTKRVLTRFGAIPMKDAYKRYRQACGRDQRVRELWGSAAPFAKG